MYQVLLVLTLFVFGLYARNLSETEEKTVEYENDNDGLGNYHFRFETSKGMIREETGRRVNIGQADEHIAVQGFYSYNDTEGVLQSVHYKADKNGYVIIDPFAGADFRNYRRIFIGIMKDFMDVFGKIASNRQQQSTFKD